MMRFYRFLRRLLTPGPTVPCVRCSGVEWHHSTSDGGGVVKCPKCKGTGRMRAPRITPIP